MTEIFIVLSLFVVLVWAIVRAVLMVVRFDVPKDFTSAHTDPIATYVDENHGSHFVEDPLTVNRHLRNR